MTQDTPKLGQLITDGEKRRDAVHVAVAPVMASHTLSPGQFVGFADEGDTECVGAYEPHLGIVDPFLVEPVRGGERFWLFLFPNTVTSLRHVWSHPAFEARHQEQVRKVVGGG